jgi:uncharacterized damage-inducible protein DinB
MSRAILLSAILALLPVCAHAEEPVAMVGIRAELERGVGEAASKLHELAVATPQAKYSYRPGKGVRSTAEVFLHVSYANFRIPTFWGVKAPDGIDLEKLEKSTTDKDQIEKLLAQSFEHVQRSLRDLPDSDWDRAIEIFGTPTTVRGGYLLLLAHMHEHLGQSIAYARANDVVPPWTARRQEAAKQKKSGM